MMKTADKHEFALYFDKLSHFILYAKSNTVLTLDDEDLCHRIGKVLRLTHGETVTLFDRQQHADFTIREVKKRTLQLNFLLQEKNKNFTPSITFLLPLLKRADLETAVYSLVEIGITTIQLVSTHKTAKELHSEKEFARLHNIMVAAAEQSKNFALPHLKEPLPLAVALTQISTPSPFIYFDPVGQPLTTILSSVQSKQAQEIFLMVGPEGDLTVEEKEFIKNYKALFCTLTPTVLRAVQAVAVGAGLFRSAL